MLIGVIGLCAFSDQTEINDRTSPYLLSSDCEANVCNKQLLSAASAYDSLVF